MARGVRIRPETIHRPREWRSVREKVETCDSAVARIDLTRHRVGGKRGAFAGEEASTIGKVMHGKAVGDRSLTGDVGVSADDEGSAQHFSALAGRLAQAPGSNQSG
jgi:hypothetical protein